MERRTVMREIKFRAWDKEEKFMLQDIHSMYDGSCNHKETEERYGWISCFDSFIDNDNYVVMQYTGLKNRNGTEIYEGDIIGFDDCTSTESGYWEQQCTGVVEWCDETASFEVSNRLSAESYEVLDECLVIGNIYENPELLK